MENINQYKANKKFRLKENTIEGKPDTEDDEGEKEEIPMLPRIPKTEIFENFELIDTKDKEKEKSRWGEYVPYQPSQSLPSFDFLDELKLKLENRQKELAVSDQAVYKEFDPHSKKFKEISKQDRDEKEVKLKEALTKIQEQEDQEREEIERAQNRITDRSGGQNPLFLEMIGRQNAEGSDDDEVYS